MDLGTLRIEVLWEKAPDVVGLSKPFRTRTPKTKEASRFARGPALSITGLDLLVHEMAGLGKDEKRAGISGKVAVQFV